MKRLLFSFLTTALLLSGCKHSYHTFKDTLKAEPTLVYRISKTGAFEQVAYISMSDIARELQVTRPGAKIQKVNLEYVSISIDKNSDNTADNLRILQLLAQETPGFIDLVRENNIDISKTQAFVANAIILKDGVEPLNNFLVKVLTATSGNSRQIGVVLRGTTLPSNKLASITLRIELKYEIEYTYCELLLDEIFGKGNDECK